MAKLAYIEKQKAQQLAEMNAKLDLIMAHLGLKLPQEVAQVEPVVEVPADEAPAVNTKRRS